MKARLRALCVLGSVAFLVACASASINEPDAGMSPPDASTSIDARGGSDAAGGDAAPPAPVNVGFGQTSGGGVGSSANYTLHLSIAPPVAATALESANYSLTLDVGISPQ